MGTVQSQPCEDVERFMLESAGSAMRDKLGETHKELYRILKQDDDNIARRPLETGTVTKSETSPVKPAGVRVSLIAELCSVPNDSLSITHDMDDYYFFAKQYDSSVSSDEESSQPPTSTSRQNSMSETPVMSVSEKPVKSAVDNRSLSESPCKSPQQPSPQPATSSTSMHDIYVDLFKTTEERMRDLLEQRAKQRLQQAKLQTSTTNTNTDSSHSKRVANPATPLTPKTPYDDRLTPQTPRGNSRTTGSMLPMLLGDIVEGQSQQRSPLSSFDRNYSKESGSVVRRILGEPASTSLSNFAVHQQQRHGNEMNQSSTSTKGLPPAETNSSLATNVYPWQRDIKPSTASQQKVAAALLGDVSRLPQTASSISDIPLDLSAKHDDCVSTQSSANIPLSNKSLSSSQHPIDAATVAAKLAAHLAVTTGSSSSSSSSAPKRSSLSELVAMPTESRRQVLGSMLSANSASSASAASAPSRHASQVPAAGAAAETERGRTGLSTASRLLAANLPNSQGGASCSSNSNEIAADEEIKKQLPSHQDHVFRSTAIRRGGLSYYPEAGVGKKSTYFQRGLAANSASLAAKQKQQQPLSNNPQQRQQQQQQPQAGESRNTSSAVAATSATGGLAQRSNVNVNVLRQLSPSGARALLALQGAAAAAAAGQSQTQKEEETLKKMNGANCDIATLLGGGAPVQDNEAVVAMVQYAGGASNNTAAAAVALATNNLSPHPHQQLPRESSVRAVLQQKLTAVIASKTTTSGDKEKNDGLTLRERLSIATDKDLTLASGVGQQQGTPQSLQQQQQRSALMDSKSRVASLLNSPSALAVEREKTLSTTTSINQLRQLVSTTANTNTVPTSAASNRTPLVANSNGQTSQSATALQGAASLRTANVSKPVVTTSSAPERKAFNSSLRRLEVGDRFTPKSSTAAFSKISIIHGPAPSPVNSSIVTSSTCVTSATRADSAAAAAASSCAVPLKRRWLASAANNSDDICGDTDGNDIATKRSCSDSTTLAGDHQQAGPLDAQSELITNPKMSPERERSPSSSVTGSPGLKQQRSFTCLDFIEQSIAEQMSKTKQ